MQESLWQGNALDAQAQAAGYRAAGNGMYVSQSRWWEAPISGQELQGKISSRQFAQQQSNPANLTGSTDYLAQIQQYLTPQASAAGGAASGTGSTDYLAQIQQYLTPQASAAGGAASGTGSTDYLAQIQQYLTPQASAAGGAASGTQTENPYEQRLQQLVNDPNSISDSNAYNFRFNQGQQALERSAAAKGMLGSGNTLAALAQYGQGMASDEYGAEVGRLGALSGQRDTYNLGLKGLANSEYGMRAGADQNRGALALSALSTAAGADQNRGALALNRGALALSALSTAAGADKNRGALALSALSTANDQRLRANQLASSTATSTGLVRPNIW